MKTVLEAADEIRKALAPLPDGYKVDAADDGSDCVLIYNETLGFVISPLAIRDDRHVETAKVMYPKLIMASPTKGTS